MRNKLNKKGFTLIELLAVILIISLIAVIAVPSITTYLNGSKNKSREILKKNIETAAENFYQECEFGTIENTNICQFNEKSLSLTLETLAEYGFLTGTGVYGDDDSIKITDPKSDANIASCTITIEKTGSTNIEYSVSYGNNCPEEW